MTTNVYLMLVGMCLLTMPEIGGFFSPQTLEPNERHSYRHEMTSLRTSALKERGEEMGKLRRAEEDWGEGGPFLSPIPLPLRAQQRRLESSLNKPPGVSYRCRLCLRYLFLYSIHSRHKRDVAKKDIEVCPTQNSVSSSSFSHHQLFCVDFPFFL